MRIKVLLLVLCALVVGKQLNAQATYYSKASATDFNNVASWGTATDGTGTAPASISNADNYVIGNGASLTLSAPASVRALYVGGGFTGFAPATTTGTLTIGSGNSLTVSTATTYNTTMGVGTNGTLTISGGNVTVNGNVIINNTFNQSGGTLNIDGNNGGSTTGSVASGTPILTINTNLLNLTAGTIVIVDPNPNSSGTAIYYNASTADYNAPQTSTHTFQLGNGVSTDATANTAGWSLNTYVGSYRMMFPNLTLSLNASTGNRSLVTTLYPFGIARDLIINSGEMRSTSAFWVGGNITNNGTLTTTSTLGLSNFPSGISTASTLAQTISGTGVFRNLATSPTANYTSLTVNNSNASGITFANAASLLNGSSTGTVSSTLTLTAGVINTSGNPFILGTGTGTLGSLSYTAGGFTSGSVFGRWYAAATAGTTITAAAVPSSTGTGSYPFINGANSRMFYINRPAVTGATGGVINVTYNEGAGGLTTIAAVTDNLPTPYSVDRQSTANWTVGTSNGFAAGTGTFSYAASNANAYVPTSGVSRLMKASSFVGTHQAGTTLPNAQRITIAAADFTGTFYQGINSADLAPPCAAPANQPTALTTGTVTSTSIPGSFTAAASAPTNYLVVRSIGALSANPVDGTTYAATATLGNGTVVQNTSATSFTTSSLATNTQYTITVFSFNSGTCSGGPKYNTASPLTSTITTCPAAPTALTTSNISQTSFDLGWTASVAGGGASPVTYTVQVSTSSTFAAGSDIAGSPFSTAGTTQNIAGLVAGTTYYYKIGAVGACTTYATSGSVITLLPPCATPSNQPTALTAGTVTSTSIPASFTAAASAPTNYLVVRSIGALTANPVDGTTYAAAATLGNGTVVQNTSALTFTASSLTGNTQYTITVFAYNNSNCSGGPKYNIASPLTGTITTCPAAPTGVVTANITINSFDLNWTASVAGGGASPINYTVQVSTSASFAAGSDVAGSPFPASGTSQSIAGLNAATTYYYRVGAVGACTTYATSGSVTTVCNAANVPYTQDFESVTTPALPNCTSIENAGTGNNWITSSPAGYGFTSKALTYVYNSTNAANAWFYTQGINLAGGTSYRITYRYGNNGGTTFPERLKVAYGNNPNSASMTNTLATHANITNNVTSITNFVDFTPGANGVYYFGFNAYSLADENRLFVDDITVNLTPSCIVPGSVAVSNLAATTATLSWSAPGTGTTPAGYQYEVRTLGAAGSGATGLAISGTTTSPTVSANIAGLSSAVTYSAYVRTDCGGGSYSSWSPAVTFTTLCTPVTTFYENFDGVTTPALPVCWAKVGTPGSAYTQSSSANSSPNTLYIYAGSTASQPVVALPPVSNVGAGTNQLRFSLRANFTVGDILQVGYLTNPTDETSFTLLQEVTASSLTYTSYSIIPGTAPGSNQVLAFRAKGTIGASMLVDDVYWEAIPSCLPPTSPVASNITTTTATVSWTAPTLSTPTGYQYEIRTTGAAGSGATGLAVSGSTTSPTVSAAITGLLPGTSYLLYVRTDCGGSGYSTWTAGYAFATPCYTSTYAAIPYTEGFESWISACSTNDLPNTNWLNTPATGNSSWRRDDDGASANWTSPTSGAFTPPYSQGAHSARFHSTYGTAGNLDMYLNMSTSGGAANLTFDYQNTSSIGVLSVLVSTNGGASFTTLASSLGTQSTWGQKGYVINSTSSNTVVRFAASSSSASYDLYIDNVSVAAQAPCVAPATQATALSLTPSNTSISGSYTAATGTPSGYVVLATPNTTAPNTAPVNGTIYTAGGTLGNATVVYVGSATTFTHSSLTSGTQYTYTVYDYNNTLCAGGPLYNITTPASASATTTVVATYTGTGNWSNAANWSTASVPNSCNTEVIIAANANVTVDGNYQAGKVTVNASTSSVTIPAGMSLNICQGLANNGTYTVSGGTSTIGTNGLFNNTLNNASGATLTVSAGTLNINGNLAVVSGSFFNQSGGNINVDGNNGGSTTGSVASGTALVSLASPNSTNISLTGGTFTIVDPHAATTASYALTANCSALTGIVASPGHTFRFGNGTSTDAGGNAVGFDYYSWASFTGGPMKLGKVIVEGPSTNNRALTAIGTYFPVIVNGDMVINNGGEFRSLNGATNVTGIVALKGNLTVNSGGTFTSSSPVYFDSVLATSATALSFGPLTAPQTVSGTGTFRNDATAPTAMFTNIFTQNSGGVTFNQDASISGSLNATPVGSAPARFTMANNSQMIEIAGAGTADNLSAANGWVIGRFQKAFATTGTPAQTFQIGDATNYTPVTVSGAAGTVTTAGTITASTKGGEYLLTTGGVPRLNSARINQDKDVNRYWTIEEGGGISFSAAGIKVTPTWVGSDVDATATPANFIVGRYLSSTGPWVYPTVSNPLTTSIEALNNNNSGANTIAGDYIIGEAASKPAVTAGLQGAMQSGGTLRNDLQQSLLLPTTDPFGLNTTYAAINNAGGPAGAVTDWVRVDVYNPALPAPALPLESHALLLRTDGSLVDTRGLVPAYAVRAGNLRLAVKHRNHMAVMSNNVLMNDVFAYNFTTSLSQASVLPGDPVQMVQVGGKWCLWAGDVNVGANYAQDYYIETADDAQLQSVLPQSLSGVYNVNDLNLDGYVETADDVLMQLNLPNSLNSTLANY